MLNNLYITDLEHIYTHTQEVFNEISNKRIFVTGCTGFFGIWLIESFLYINKKMNLNSHMTILTRNKKKFISLHNHLTNFSEIDFLEGDICSFEFPQNKYEYIIHGAAEVSNDEISAIETVATIVNGTKHILDFANHNQTKKLLFISSGAAYGKQIASLPYITEESNIAPLTTDSTSVYGESKRLAELLCVLAAKKGILEIKIARCFAFIGPYLPLNSRFAVGNFIKDVIEGKNIVIKSNIQVYRSYLYASDLAIWLWTILIKGNNCEIYNVGSDKEISLIELANLILKVSKSNCKVLVNSSQNNLNLIDRYVPSIEKSNSSLNLKPTISLELAIEKTLNWNKKLF
ncbi:NAD(P)-dependent oxidoreductase [Pigmentibacter sp. JX0631]|uniref:NAD-dependent epimerase/dehydratase family protein n=1 Tax=Pigmentibacter sp. JX0631 TaxID=2976982 RepID=UPI002469A103|nr:NAD(P)-dependent oxidoreductase [Pigmentibacter sp. JX0631]WGL60827.1 NAD(P)-dependent oxidoreductase [Pigmentibacter sp. JX0631]